MPACCVEEGEAKVFALEARKQLSDGTHIVTTCKDTNHTNGEQRFMGAKVGIVPRACVTDKMPLLTKGAKKVGICVGSV